MRAFYDLAGYFSAQITTAEQEAGRVYEPMIGVVTDNKDPDKLGRVKVKNPGGNPRRVIKSRQGSKIIFDDDPRLNGGAGMRTQLVIALAALCAGSSFADADPAKAKAANTAGYKLHKKKYKEAAVEYRKAIAEDPNHLLAHYNLACVASLVEDGATATAELAWVADRATWDPAAKAAFKKAPKDKDLWWVINETKDGKAAFDASEATNLTEEDEDFGVSAPSKDAALAKALALGDKHEAACSADVVALPIKMKGSKFFKNTIAASLREGVAVIDATSAVKHDSDPLGCTDAKDQVQRITRSFAVSHSYQMLTTPLDEEETISVLSSRGTDHQISVFIAKDKQLVRVFEAPYKKAGKTAKLVATPLGNLVYTAPGEKKPRVFRFDTTAFKYVE